MGTSEKHKKAMESLGKELKSSNKEKYYKNPKECKFCGQPIDYDKRHTNSFCNQSCSASFNNLKRTKKISESKFCEFCKEKPLNRHQDKFCSQDCANTYKKKENIEKWLSGEKKLSSRTIKEYLLSLDPACNICRIVQWNNLPITLELDHIDGNSENNNLENLRVLCPNCHSQTPTYKAKNLGNGRYSRKIRYQNGKSY